MEHKIVQNTWSMRQISSFGDGMEYTIPSHNHSDDDSSSSSSSSSEMNRNHRNSIDNECTLEQQEETMTRWLQNHYSFCGEKANLNFKPKKRKIVSVLDKKQGNYVSLNWIYIPPHRDSTVRKEPEEDILRTNPESFYHLHIEIWIQDESRAQILLCFPLITTRRNSNKNKSAVPQIKSFSFLLLRGSKDTAKILFTLFEHEYQFVISNHSHPLQFSPSEIATALSFWTLAEHCHCSSSNASSSNTASPARPMEVAFTLPSMIAQKGLEKMTLTIPPSALLNLCKALQTEQLLQQQSESSSNTNHSNNISTSNLVSMVYMQQLPILKALQCFILETFHIDIRSFHLSRAACGLGALSCDGRCKPINPFYLYEFLITLRWIIDSKSNGK